LGEQVWLNGETGTLDAIGTVSAEITLPNSWIVIPNSDLTDKMVKTNTARGRLVGV
jgi:hypothetical protein